MGSLLDMGWDPIGPLRWMDPEDNIWVVTAQPAQIPELIQDLFLLLDALPQRR